jgi:hypothetical protein
MRTFAQKQRSAPQTKSARPTPPGRPPFARDHAARAILHSQQPVRQTTGGPALQRKELTAEAKHQRVLRAADRARRYPDDRVRMAANGSEIVYRLIDLYIPTFKDLLSGVSYEPSVATVRAEATAGDTVSIKIGKAFILETNSTTLGTRAAEIIRELSRWKSRFQVDPRETEDFREQVSVLMDTLMVSSQPGLRLLYEWILHSPVPISVRSVSLKDKSTLHVNEKETDPEKLRSHTDPSDTKARGAERDTMTGSTIFINPLRLNLTDGGTFVHELVHARDLAYGLYNSNVKIRERRAVFFENMWRDEQGELLRPKYRGKYATLDYQKAVQADKDGHPNGVAAVTAYLLFHNDFPPGIPGGAGG